MGICASAPVEVIEGLGTVIYDQDGMKINHQIKSGSSIHSKRGRKAVNQDSAVLCQGYGSENVVMCGVFDGHGRNGHLVSKIISRRLPLLLIDKKNAVSEVNENHTAGSLPTDDGSSMPNNELLEWEKAYMNAFMEMDEEIKMVKSVDSSFSGSTAVVALKLGDDLVIANLGDSRAILGTKSKDGVTVVQLTIDLKPGTPGEGDRIRSSKGKVYATEDEPSIPRAWLPRDYDTFGISVSRCFGDFVMKEYGIISTPVITHHRITSDDLFILLSSDGVYDVLSNDQIVSIVCGVEHEGTASKAVIDAAVAAWKNKVPCNYRDDCTVVCYFFHKEDQLDTSHTNIAYLARY